MSTPTLRPAPWPHEESPFHAAELALQERFGWRKKLDVGVRRDLRAFLTEQHQGFFGQLPFVLIGAVDETGQPWASLLAGRPGFATSTDPTLLHVGAVPGPDDPLASALREGASVGLLGIEPHTRRRNRLNGSVEARSAMGFDLRVAQSYGNCPQYIQSRDFRFAGETAVVAPARAVRRASQLSNADIELLERADTFFIASANLKEDAGIAGGADVSHRGGRPGFVRVDDRSRLTTPDFVGNYFFNTIGNLQVEPRAGLLFVDFERGDLLLIAARAEVIWDGPEVTAFAGAQRLIRLRISQVIRLAGALPWRASKPEYARELIGTGTWAEAALAFKAQNGRER